MWRTNQETIFSLCGLLVSLLIPTFIWFSPSFEIPSKLLDLPPWNFLCVCVCVCAQTSACRRTWWISCCSGRWSRPSTRWRCWPCLRRFTSTTRSSSSCSESRWSTTPSPWWDTHTHTHTLRHTLSHLIMWGVLVCCYGNRGLQGQ